MLGEWGICGEVMRGIGLAGDSLRGDVMVAIIVGGGGGVVGWRLEVAQRVNLVMDLTFSVYLVLGRCWKALCTFERWGL